MEIIILKIKYLIPLEELQINKYKDKLIISIEIKIIKRSLLIIKKRIPRKLLKIIKN